VLPVVRNSADQDPMPEDLSKLKSKFFKDAAQPSSQQGGGELIDNVNPYTLGRQARKAFDEVWSQLSNLASPTKSFVIDDTMEPNRDVEFVVPQAAYTTVLVVGATGRVGRVLTRKLLLRGYKVKALVRRRDGKARNEIEGLPSAVEVVEGDLGDVNSCQDAVRGVNKIIFCAAARTTLSADLTRVDDRGVVNIVKALQDEYIREAKRNRKKQSADAAPKGNASIGRSRVYSHKTKKEIADFSEVYHQLRWDVTFVGTPGDATGSMDGGDPMTKTKWAASSSATAEVTEEDHLAFSGQLYGRSAYAEVGAPLAANLPGGEHRTAKTEALVMRVRGDGQQYLLVVKTESGVSYGVRFFTRPGWLTVRLPWSSFRPDREGAAPLDPANITNMAIRFEAKRAGVVAMPARAGAKPAAPAPANGRFELEVDWIKALPSGDEPDVVLVSCAGGAREGNMDVAQIAKMVAAKRRGEEGLRASGLAYTIIRPGQLVDEPGGYRALVFDQGDRVSQPVSAADVADICLRALHEPAAVNKTFDVCYELPADASGDSLFELVSSVPDKSGQYLADAAKLLTKNT